MAKGGNWRARKYAPTQIRIGKLREKMEDVYARSTYCQKVTYADKREAGLALLKVRAVRRHEQHAGVALPGKGERSVYRCGRCGLWHLTSLPKRRGANRIKPGTP